MAGTSGSSFKNYTGLVDSFLGRFGKSECARIMLNFLISGLTYLMLSRFERAIIYGDSCFVCAEIMRNEFVLVCTIGGSKAFYSMLFSGDFRISSGILMSSIDGEISNLLYAMRFEHFLVIGGT